MKNRFNIGLVLTLFSLVCIFSLPAFAQSNNSIVGFVFTSDRQVLEDIPIELLDEFHRTLARTKSDRSGKYSFSRLAQGRYYIKALPLATSFEEQTAELEIVNIIQNSSESFQKDFYLRDKNANRPKQAMVGFIFAQEIPPAAKKHYETANDRLKDDKKQDEATSELLMAIDVFPDYYLALERLAQQYIKAKNYDNAVTVASRAVAINPKGYESWYALGYANFQLKRSQEAVVALKAAIDLNAVSINSLFLIGVSLRQQEKYQDAEDYLLRAKKLATSPVPEIHWQLALLYTNDLKKYAAAAKELELFLKASPNYNEAEKVRDLIKRLKSKEKT